MAPPETYHEACLAGDSQWFSNNYPNAIEPYVVNRVNEKGESCLHLAAKSSSVGAVEVTRRFLNSGGRFNAKVKTATDDNPTALAVNVEYGNYDAIKIMLEHKAWTNITFRYNGRSEEDTNVMDVAMALAAGKGEGTLEMKMARLLGKYGAKTRDGKGVPPPPPPPLPPPVEPQAQPQGPDL